MTIFRLSIDSLWKPYPHIKIIELIYNIVYKTILKIYAIIWNNAALPRAEFVLRS